MRCLLWAVLVAGLALGEAVTSEGTGNVIHGCLTDQLAKATKLCYSAMEEYLKDERLTASQETQFCCSSFGLDRCSKFAFSHLGCTNEEILKEEFFRLMDAAIENQVLQSHEHCFQAGDEECDVGLNLFWQAIEEIADKFPERPLIPVESPPSNLPRIPKNDNFKSSNESTNIILLRSFAAEDSNYTSNGTHEQQITSQNNTILYGNYRSQIILNSGFGNRTRTQRALLIWKKNVLEQAVVLDDWGQPIASLQSRIETVANLDLSKMSYNKNGSLLEWTKDSEIELRRYSSNDSDTTVSLLTAQKDEEGSFYFVEGDQSEYSNINPGQLYDWLKLYNFNTSFSDQNKSISNESKDPDLLSRNPKFLCSAIVAYLNSNHSKPNTTINLEDLNSVPDNGTVNESPSLCKQQTAENGTNIKADCEDSHHEPTFNGTPDFDFPHRNQKLIWNAVVYLLTANTSEPNSNNRSENGSLDNSRNTEDRQANTTISTNNHTQSNNDLEHSNIDLGTELAVTNASSPDFPHRNQKLIWNAVATFLNANTTEEIASNRSYNESWDNIVNMNGSEEYTFNETRIPKAAVELYNDSDSFLVIDLYNDTETNKSSRSVSDEAKFNDFNLTSERSARAVIQQATLKPFPWQPSMEISVAPENSPVFFGNGSTGQNAPQARELEVFLADSKFGNAAENAYPNVAPINHGDLEFTPDRSGRAIIQEATLPTFPWESSMEISLAPENSPVFIGNGSTAKNPPDLHQARVLGELLLDKKIENSAEDSDYLDPLFDSSPDRSGRAIIQEATLPTFPWESSMEISLAPDNAPVFISNGSAAQNSPDLRHARDFDLILPDNKINKAAAYSPPKVLSFDNDGFELTPDKSGRAIIQEATLPTFPWESSMEISLAPDNSPVFIGNGSTVQNPPDLRQAKELEVSLPENKLNVSHWNWDVLSLDENNASNHEADSERSARALIQEATLPPFPWEPSMEISLAPENFPVFVGNESVHNSLDHRQARELGGFMTDNVHNVPSLDENKVHSERSARALILQAGLPTFKWQPSMEITVAPDQLPVFIANPPANQNSNVLRKSRNDPENEADVLPNSYSHVLSSNELLEKSASNGTFYTDANHSTIIGTDNITIYSQEWVSYLNRTLSEDLTILTNNSKESRLLISKLNSSITYSNQENSFEVSKYRDFQNSFGNTSELHNTTISSYEYDDETALAENRSRSPGKRELRSLATQPSDFNLELHKLFQHLSNASADLNNLMDEIPKLTSQGITFLIESIFNGSCLNIWNGSCMPASRQARDSFNSRQEWVEFLQGLRETGQFDQANAPLSDPISNFLSSLNRLNRTQGDFNSTIIPRNSTKSATNSSVSRTQGDNINKYPFLITLQKGGLKDKNVTVPSNVTDPLKVFHSVNGMEASISANPQHEGAGSLDKDLATTKSTTHEPPHKKSASGKQLSSGLYSVVLLIFITLIC